MFKQGDKVKIKDSVKFELKTLWNRGLGGMSGINPKHMDDEFIVRGYDGSNLRTVSTTDKNYTPSLNDSRFELCESKLSKMINRIIKEEVRKVRLKESSSQQEIESLAVDLIDYMGKELPPRPNPRILRWFQEAGITDQNLIKQIYQRALQLNKE